MERVQVDLDRINKLARDKVDLAKRLVAFMARTCGRLGDVTNRIQAASDGKGSSAEPSTSSVPTTRVTNKILGAVRSGIDIPGPTSSTSTASSAGPVLKRACEPILVHLIIISDGIPSCLCSRLLIITCRSADEFDDKFLKYSVHQRDAAASSIQTLKRHQSLLFSYSDFSPKRSRQGYQSSQRS